MVVVPIVLALVPNLHARRRRFGNGSIWGRSLRSRTHRHLENLARQERHLGNPRLNSKWLSHLPGTSATPTIPTKPKQRIEVRLEINSSFATSKKLTTKSSRTNAPLHESAVSERSFCRHVALFSVRASLSRIYTICAFFARSRNSSLIRRHPKGRDSTPRFR